jgi:hypothetical protein
MQRGWKNERGAGPRGQKVGGKQNSVSSRDISYPPQGKEWDLLLVSAKILIQLWEIRCL